MKKLHLSPNSDNDNDKANANKSNSQIKDNKELKQSRKYKHAPLKKSNITNLTTVPSNSKRLQQSSSTTDILPADKRLNLVSLTEEIKAHHSESIGNFFINNTKAQSFTQQSKRQKDTHALIKTLEIIQDVKDKDNSNTEDEDINMFISFNLKDLRSEEKAIVVSLKENFTIHDILSIIIQQRNQINEQENKRKKEAIDFNKFVINDKEVKDKKKLELSAYLTLDRDKDSQKEKDKSLKKQSEVIEKLMKEKESLEKKNEYLMNELIKETYIKQKMFNTINEEINNMNQINEKLQEEINR